jgi:hypothetical protein
MWAMTHRPGQAKLAGNGPNNGAFCSDNRELITTVLFSSM